MFCLIYMVQGLTGWSAFDKVTQFPIKKPSLWATGGSTFVSMTKMYFESRQS